MIILRKASERDIKKILLEKHITGVSSERMEMCRIGCQLGYLFPDDVAFIADPNTSLGDANRRITTRRRDVF